MIRGTAQTDVTRPYFPGKQLIFPSQAPAVPSPTDPGPSMLSWCRGPRSGVDATVMIYIPFVYGSCMQRCVRMVCCSTPPLSPVAVLLLLATSASDDAKNAGARRESRRACSSHQPVGCALSVIAPARRGQVTSGDLQPATSRVRLFGHPWRLVIIVVIDGHQPAQQVTDSSGADDIPR